MFNHLPYGATQGALFQFRGFFNEEDRLRKNSNLKKQPKIALPLKNKKTQIITLQHIVKKQRKSLSVASPPRVLNKKVLRAGFFLPSKKTHSRKKFVARSLIQPYNLKHPTNFRPIRLAFFDMNKKRAFIRPNLLGSKFLVAVPNLVWSMDISELSDTAIVGTSKDKKHTNKLRLLVVLDLASKKIIASLVGSNITSLMIYRVLKTAIEEVQRYGRLNKTLTLHSDRGTEFLSKTYHRLSKDFDFVQLSMNSPCSPTQNAVSERFFRTIKGLKPIWRKAGFKKGRPTSFKTIHAALSAYRAFSLAYNQRFRSPSTFNLAPYDFEAALIFHQNSNKDPLDITLSYNKAKTEPFVKQTLAITDFKQSAATLYREGNSTSLLRDSTELRQACLNINKDPAKFSEVLEKRLELSAAQSEARLSQQMIQAQAHTAAQFAVSRAGNKYEHQLTRDTLQQDMLNFQAQIVEQVAEVVNLALNKRGLTPKTFKRPHVARSLRSGMQIEFLSTIQAALLENSPHSECVIKLQDSLVVIFLRGLGTRISEIRSLTFGDVKKLLKTSAKKKRALQKKKKG